METMHSHIIITILGQLCFAFGGSNEQFGTMRTFPGVQGRLKCFRYVVKFR